MPGIGQHHTTTSPKAHDNHDLKETVDMMRCTRYSGLPTAARLLLKEIIDRSRWIDGELACYPSEETLCFDTGIDSSTTLKKYLASIEAAGFFRRRYRTPAGAIVDKQYVGNQFCASYYILNCGALSALNRLTKEEKREHQIAARTATRSGRKTRGGNKRRRVRSQTLVTEPSPSFSVPGSQTLVTEPSPTFGAPGSQTLVTNVPTPNELNLNDPQANDASARENQSELSPSTDELTTNHVIDGSDDLAPSRSQTETPPPPPPPPPAKRGYQRDASQMITATCSFAGCSNMWQVFPQNAKAQMLCPELHLPLLKQQQAQERRRQRRAA